MEPPADLSYKNTDFCQDSSKPHCRITFLVPAEVSAAAATCRASATCLKPGLRKAQPPTDNYEGTYESVPALPLLLWQMQEARQADMHSGAAAFSKLFPSAGRV